MLDALKKEVCASVDRLGSTLVEVSHEIHAHPELAFRELHAARLLADTGRAQGLDVHQNVYGLETALEARFGKAGPTVALLSEYDALPGIGHACGHNIIATTALGAALALAELGARLPGAVRWLGTPAEEGGGGKEIMARAGAFEGVDAALMIHPAGVNLVTMPCLAISDVEVVYHGVASHASAMPERGVNALDALVIAYQAIGALRQHIRSTERLHGIISDGGQAPNIVPERAAGRFYVRAANAGELSELKKRVTGCFRAGAEATGAKLELHWGEVDYLDLDTSWPLAQRFQRNAESLGRAFFPYDKLPAGMQGSTDMGNVSHRVPSIHPMLASAPPHVSIHNAEFARWAASELGDQSVLDGAKALAMTALDFLCDSELRSEVGRAFAASRAARGL
ncbi:MAG TPA: M20 family metallopeptidase [Myxococcota bacterium]|nr:M20 family metallopeptidase [Myxococcota bacterium]